jgi:hypothetical protein
MIDADSAQYYVEKFLDGRTFGMFRAMLELLPDSKVLMLFRDPRDVYLSLAAFSKKEKIISLDGDSETKIESTMNHYKMRLKLSEEYPDKIHIIKYEDLIADSQRTIEDFVKFLSISDDASIINNMITVMQDKDLQSSRHITAGSRKKSMYRWKAELQEADSVEFGKYKNIFEKLGYD